MRWPATSFKVDRAGWEEIWLFAGVSCALLLGTLFISRTADGEDAMLRAAGLGPYAVRCNSRPAVSSNTRASIRDPELREAQSALAP